mmetsp:Transcript_22959/g.51232  ORF Transcript_22959/g.51232 Transcript_22959/m.51232 type:complete len:370 (+) Transcript_22959:597-1706(+)
MLSLSPSSMLTPSPSPSLESLSSDSTSLPVSSKLANPRIDCRTYLLSSAESLLLATWLRFLFASKRARTCDWRFFRNCARVILMPVSFEASAGSETSSFRSPRLALFSETSLKLNLMELRMLTLRCVLRSRKLTPLIDDLPRVKSPGLPMAEPLSLSILKYDFPELDLLAFSIELSSRGLTINSSAATDESQSDLSCFALFCFFFFRVPLFFDPRYDSFKYEESFKFVSPSESLKPSTSGIVILNEIPMSEAVISSSSIFITLLISSSTWSAEGSADCFSPLDFAAPRHRTIPSDDRNASSASLALTIFASVSSISATFEATMPAPICERLPICLVSLSIPVLLLRVSVKSNTIAPCLVELLRVEIESL